MWVPIGLLEEILAQPMQPVMSDMYEKMRSYYRKHMGEREYHKVACADLVPRLALHEPKYAFQET